MRPLAVASLPFTALLFLSLLVVRPIGAQGTAAPAQPPCSAQEFRQFDFWVGDWEVRGPNGQVVGHNRIEREIGGCAIVERWTSVGPNRGISLNFYDPASKQWHQTWIGTGGQALYLDGTLRDGSMVMETESTSDSGRVTRQRITWTPQDGGAVRQHWEMSSDGGRSWRTLFDGRYRRR